jgi:hypothetical protein
MQERLQTGILSIELIDRLARMICRLGGLRLSDLRNERPQKAKCHIDITSVSFHHQAAHVSIGRSVLCVELLNSSCIRTARAGLRQ